MVRFHGTDRALLLVAERLESIASHPGRPEVTLCPGEKVHVELSEVERKAWHALAGEVRKAALGQVPEQRKPDHADQT